MNPQQPQPFRVAWRGDDGQVYRLTVTDNAGNPLRHPTGDDFERLGIWPAPPVKEVENLATRRLAAQYLAESKLWEAGRETLLRRQEDMTIRRIDPVIDLGLPADWKQDGAALPDGRRMLVDHVIHSQQAIAITGVWNTFPDANVADVRFWLGYHEIIRHIPMLPVACEHFTWEVLDEPLIYLRHTALRVDVLTVDTGPVQLGIDGWVIEPRGLHQQA